MAEDEITIYIDKEEIDKPDIEIVSPSEKAEFTAGEPINIEVEVEDIDSLESTIRYIIATEDKKYQVARTEEWDTSATLTVSESDIDQYGEGEYMIIVKVVEFDLMGNTNTIAEDEISI